ncbi:hypothetical protein DFH07DRAFT_814279 [Mycena maculata]|uniref:MYND-type domain-containing protein n=1 Tax=Mycena maculata TaxID=230809 RepID=A0AAD7JGZ9_9AGAR|nr:hypothetical protein DFH07DRAFT_814279 [Mycena maculata]
MCGKMCGRTQAIPSFLNSELPPQAARSHYTMNHDCNNCGNPASKRCSGCTLSTAWYCSGSCQRHDWVEHIFQCNPRRNITTTDHLALAVRTNLFPEDLQTCKDFGFAKAFSVENRSKLLGVYIGLIERIGVSPKTIRQWQQHGSLVENIKATFSTIPERSRGGYYPWFLDNQWILDSSVPGPTEDPVDAMMMRSWRYYRGGANRDTIEEIKAEMSNWPEEKQASHLLCNLILSQLHPSPDLITWITFGFCACRDEAEEKILARWYTTLIGQCTFEELYHAYDSSSLIALFDSKGVRAGTETIVHLEEVLKGSPREFKSVWYLKQFVMAQGEEYSKPIPSVIVDYGFMNCYKSEEETTLLKDLYSQIFSLPRADPVQLHEACIQGKLYDLVSRLLKLKKKDQKVLKRLLKNPYPLPDL